MFLKILVLMISPAPVIYVWTAVIRGIDKHDTGLYNKPKVRE
ncbi:hypothetical protein DEALK_05740 [Dehalogenimonas alkenigignens]|uniref:Uncharacterized protein n=1 Tax=Dehalogenimonas alkenigignens TaxID=1217799 RepID=A0A0W0GGR2_9CHLR|nr:hypothetical protein DEALK_05740 [Dehalogenimonas alkenigignens]